MDDPAAPPDQFRIRILMLHILLVYKTVSVTKQANLSEQMHGSTLHPPSSLIGLHR